MPVLLWDFDDTLGFRDGKWGAALMDAVRRALPGHPLTLDELRPHLMHGFPWHNHHLPHTHIRNADAWWNDLMNPILAGALRDAGIPSPHADAAAALVRQEFPRLERWSLFPETASVLQELAGQGWRHLILSNHVPELPDILEHLGIRHYFAHVVNSATTGFEKPHPNAFACALEWCEREEPVWMIGDNFTADIEGAAAAGIPGILVQKPHPQADRYAETLWEVVGIVGRGGTQEIGSRIKSEHQRIQPSAHAEPQCGE